ncbi:hypothetical protein ZWY2020_008114 [Hordeum vulgare]|nr:hypothetical protein ZWY2020_008114 [Hordeum vulgare]
MVMDTTDPGYWLNWRFVLCATGSCSALLGLLPHNRACYLIWKYEGPSSPASNDEGVDREEPCLDDIHPAWLLAFRLVSFLFMASVIIYDVIVDGWTLGSVLSVYGCYQYACKTDKSDADHGSYIIAPTEESTYNNSIKSSCLNKTHDGREIAGFWGYLFQIIFWLRSTLAFFVGGATALPLFLDLGELPWYRVTFISFGFTFILVLSFLVFIFSLRGISLYSMMHYGLIEMPIRIPWACPRTKWFTAKHVVYLLS